MSRIPDDVLDSIRQATDIVELVGRYVPLQRSGHDFKARCPFHQEKTPSFYVVPDKEMWTCFGCHKGGNVFSFLMEREGLTFLEAVRQLAGAAGITIDSTASPEAAAQASRLGRLREVCDWACRRFQAGLRWKEGARAREYLKGRGMTGETANLFRLGYAPAGWDNLLGAASREGIGEQDLLDAGLVIARDGGRGGSYDRFRDRVVFPIQDAQGRVIAFGARTLADEEPKYLNSPETPLFTKGRHLYALHLAKKEMLRTGEGAVMEGYTDVILTHQAGWPVAVAGLGTALTREQAALASRYVKKLYLVYDGDAAGLRAAERAIPEFLPEAIETRVAVLPPGEDPADVAARAGIPGLPDVLSRSRDAFDHLLAVRAAAHDVSTVPGRAQAVQDVLQALAGVQDDLRRALYLKRLAEEYSAPESVLADTLRQIRGRAMRESRARETGAGEVAAPQRAASPTPTPIPIPIPRDGYDASRVEVENSPAPRPREPMPQAPAVEELLVEAVLGHPALLDEVEERLPRAAVTHPGCREMLERLLQARRPGVAPDPAAVVARLEDPELAGFGATLLHRATGKDLLRQGRDCLERLGAMHEERQVHEGLKRATTPAEQEDLLRRLVEIHRRRSVSPRGLT